MATSNAAKRRQQEENRKIMQEVADSCAEAPKMTMLQKAHELIYSDRQQDYGPALENFQNIADLWSVVLKTPVTPDQVALCMIQVKVARLVRSPNHEDSWIDIAGYVGCKQKMIDGD